MYQQRTRNSALELNRKGLCLQEFTILLDFSVKSFMALIVSTDKFHRFQKKGVQKRQQSSGKNGMNLSQGMRIGKRGVTADWLSGGLQRDMKQIEFLQDLLRA